MDKANINCRYCTNNKKSTIKQKSNYEKRYNNWQMPI